VIQQFDYFASGSGRICHFTTLSFVPLPVSMWNGTLLPKVDHKPRPFQPALGSSMRPSFSEEPHGISHAQGDELAVQANWKRLGGHQDRVQGTSFCGL
jgi:hypothetical protein